MSGSYTMKASAIPACADLLANRAQLKSRMAQLAGVTTMADMLSLLSGTTVEGVVLQQAQAAVGLFLKNGLDQIEAEIVAMGIELDT
jgi:hypothetical protein